MDPNSNPSEGHSPSADIIPFRRPSIETPTPPPAPEYDGDDDGPTAA